MARCGSLFVFAPQYPGGGEACFSAKVSCRLALFPSVRMVFVTTFWHPRKKEGSELSFGTFLSRNMDDRFTTHVQRLLPCLDRAFRQLSCERTKSLKRTSG